MAERKYPQELTVFGNELRDIFGTPEEQKRKKSLKSIAGNSAIIEELLSRLPNGGKLDVYEEFGRNARPTFLEVAVKVLKMIEQSGIFKEYKLPPLGDTISRVGGTEAEWTQLYLRYPVQRDVKVWHIIKDILIEWDDNLNDPAYVRVLSDGTMNVNDKQHGNFGRLIMGAEKVIIEGIQSDDECMDSNMYASRNIQALASSWENNANVHVNRAEDYQSAGRVVKVEDQRYLDFYNLLQEFDCIWVEKGTSKIQARQCDHGKRLFKIYNQHGSEIFKTGVSLNVATWPAYGELSVEFVDGCTEFLKQMTDAKFTKSQMQDIQSAVKEAMKDTYHDTKKTSNRGTGPGTLWGSVGAFTNTLQQSGTTKDYRITIAANYRIAAGLRDLIMNYNMYHKSRSNITKLKLDIPLIKDKDGTEFEIQVPYFPDGFKKDGKGEYHRNSSTAKALKFDHTELDFEEENEEI